MGRQFQDPNTLFVTGGHKKIIKRSNNNLNTVNAHSIIKEAQEATRNVSIHIPNHTNTQKNNLAPSIAIKAEEFL